MSSSSAQSVFVEELAAQMIVQNYDNMSIVTIPGWTVLSESQKKQHSGALLKKLQYELNRGDALSPEREQPIQPALDVEAINFTLQKFLRPSPTPSPTPTPPPDSNIERAHSYEDQARKDLIADHCPPCYPIHLEFPLRVIPEKYARIVSYWRSLPGTGNVVLCAQLSDWRSFRRYQGEVRRHYLQRKTFCDFEKKVRDRRQRHGLEGNVCLHSEPAQQKAMGDWIEFQNYHVEIHEGLENDLKDAREKLVVAQKEMETGASGPAVAEDVEIFNNRVRYYEGQLRNHQTLLLWVEEQRVALVAKPALTDDALETQDDRKQTRKDESTIDRRQLAPAQRKRAPKPRSPLSPIRAAVSKKSAVKRKRLKPANRAAPQPAENLAVHDESNLPRRSERISHLRSNNSQRDKGSTPLRPFRPQKVTKTAKKSQASQRSAIIKAESRRTDRLQGRRIQDAADRARSKRRKPMEQPAPVRGKATLSGRVTKRPPTSFPAR